MVAHREGNDAYGEHSAGPAVHGDLRALLTGTTVPTAGDGTMEIHFPDGHHERVPQPHMRQPHVR